MMNIDLQEKLDEVADRHRHPQPIDALHTRASAAIERLGLDGSKLELAVAVFGWGSDEANGSLLGVVRVAWGVPIQVTPPRTGCVWLIYAITGVGVDQSSQRIGREPDETEALVAALEAKQP